MTAIRFNHRPTAAVAAAALRGPDWSQAKLDWIEGALHRALRRPSGGWFVVAASRAITSEPSRWVVAGRELVAWRPTRDAVRVAPDECPHMGASLAQGCARRGKLVCPWHGLALGPDKRHGRWSPVTAHDDGVLVWARLGDVGEPAVAPILPPRPDVYVDEVIDIEARCDVEDVIANRLDPWHGAHFHPYAFRRLEVTDISDDDVLTMRVSKRVIGPIALDVTVTFHSPEPRTIVMTIVDGEGTGSVVETHAVPIAPQRTRIVEATLAASPRRGFRHARRAARFIRPFLRRAALRLWTDDAAYAERRCALRARAAL